jgi:hypothetical protein
MNIRLQITVTSIFYGIIESNPIEYQLSKAVKTNRSNQLINK